MKGLVEQIQRRMRALEKSESKIFVRKDKLHDTVDRSLCNNFHLASRWYRENVAEKKLQSRKRKLGIIFLQASVSKKKAKEILRKKEEKHYIYMFLCYLFAIYVLKKKQRWDEQLDVNGRSKQRYINPLYCSVRLYRFVRYAMVERTVAWFNVTGCMNASIE